MKKILCIILVAVCAFSSVGVSAKKRDDEEKVNYVNLTPYGNFDGEYTLRHIYTMPEPDIKISWVAGGARQSVGAMKIETNPWYSASFHIPNIIGQTYDVSFYGRVDSGTKQLAVQPTFTDGNYLGIIYYSTFTPEWKKYTFTYYCDGQKSTSDMKFSIQCGDMVSRETFYIDEFEVVPRGNVTVKLPTKAQMNSEAASIVQHDMYQAEFSDISESWAKSIITVLAANNLINGMGDGTFSPEKSVTRAEFVTMAANLLRVKKREYQKLYADVSQNDWFSGDVQVFGAGGFIAPEMSPDGFFRPQEPIAREEATFILYNALKEAEGLVPDFSDLAFSDADKISAWAKQSVQSAVSAGLITGFPDNTFMPKKSLTRADAAMLIFKAAEQRDKLAVFVDGEKGSDSNEGTFNSPLATIEGARIKLQPLLKNMQHDLYVFIKEGNYNLTSPVKWGVEDSGKNGYSVIYTAWGSEKPVFTAGKEYGDFQLHDKEKNIYKTYVGTDVAAGQVYFNKKPGVRADEKISLINSERSDEGFYICDNTELLNYSHFEDIMLVYIEGNRRGVAIAEKAEQTPDGRVKLTIKPDSWFYHNENEALKLSFPVEIRNSYELLDCGGEWFLSKHDGFLYYIPRDGENPSEITATISGCENAFTVVGNNSFNKASNIRFDSLAFSYTAFLYPVTNGKGWRDEGRNYESYTGDGNKLTGGQEDAAVNITNAENIHITNCSFSNLDGSGINFRKAFSGCRVTGSEFYNIAGAAINLGNCLNDGAEFSNPTEKHRERARNFISGNIIHDTGFEFSGAPAVNISWICDSEISGNEIYNVPYCAIYAGQSNSNESGMRNVKIAGNYINDVTTVISGEAVCAFGDGIIQ